MPHGVHGTGSILAGDKVGQPLNAQDGNTKKGIFGGRSIFKVNPFKALKNLFFPKSQTSLGQRDVKLAQAKAFVNTAQDVQKDLNEVIQKHQQTVQERREALLVRQKARLERHANLSRIHQPQPAATDNVKRS